MAEPTAERMLKYMFDCEGCGISVLHKEVEMRTLPPNDEVHEVQVLCGDCYRLRQLEINGGGQVDIAYSLVSI